MFTSHNDLICRSIPILIIRLSLPLTWILIKKKKSFHPHPAVCFFLVSCYLLPKQNKTCSVFICSSPLTDRPNKGNTNVVARKSTRERVWERKDRWPRWCWGRVVFLRRSCSRLWERGGRKDVKKFSSRALISWQVKGIALQEHLHHLHLFTLAFFSHCFIQPTHPKTNFSSFFQIWLDKSFVASRTSGVILARSCFCGGTRNCQERKIGWWILGTHTEREREAEQLVQSF